MNSIKLFTIGLFSQFAFRFVGVWRISDFILFIFFILNIKACFRLLEDKTFRNLILFSVLSLIGISFSDFYNGNSILNSLKGAIGWFLIVPNFFVFKYLLNDDIYKIRYFIYGFIISSVIILFFPKFSASYYGFGEGEAALRILTGADAQGPLQKYLKYGLLISLIVTFFYYKLNYKLTSVFLFCFGFFCLFAGSRYRFLIYETAAIILLYLGNISNLDDFEKSKFSKISLWKLMLFFVAASIIVRFYYGYAAESGLLGNRAQEKYYSQTNSKIGIFSARSEFFAGLYAVSKSPIIGYGSYAIDHSGLNRDFYTKILKLKRYSNSNNYIQSHSIILGFYIQGGIFTVFIWIFILVQILKFLKRNVVYDYRLSAYLLLASLTLLWDILFSPFSNRIENSVIIIAILIINTNCQTRRIE